MGAIAAAKQPDRKVIENQALIIVIYPNMFPWYDLIKNQQEPEHAATMRTKQTLNPNNISPLNVHLLAPYLAYRDGSGKT